MELRYPGGDQAYRRGRTRKRATTADASSSADGGQRNGPEDVCRWPKRPAHRGPGRTPAPGGEPEPTAARGAGRTAVGQEVWPSVVQRLRCTTPRSPRPPRTAMKPIETRNTGDVGEAARAPAMTYAAVFGMCRARREQEGDSPCGRRGAVVAGRTAVRGRAGGQHRPEAVPLSSPSAPPSELARNSGRSASWPSTRPSRRRPGAEDGAGERRREAGRSAKRAPAARLRSGRGTKAAVHTP